MLKGHPMRFDLDDLDWAMGELAHLFMLANLHSAYPHLLNPELFRTAWHVIMWQPPEVAKHCHQTLMAMSSGKWQQAQPLKTVKRYAIALPH